MTIMATHFAIVLGAWRLRIRIDIDEPREPLAVRSTRVLRNSRYSRHRAFAGHR